jgi:hypothetical protein
VARSGGACEHPLERAVLEPGGAARHAGGGHLGQPRRAGERQAQQLLRQHPHRVVPADLCRRPARGDSLRRHAHRGRGHPLQEQDHQRACQERGRARGRKLDRPVHRHRRVRPHRRLVLGGRRIRDGGAIPNEKKTVPNINSDIWVIFLKFGRRNLENLCPNRFWNKLEKFSDFQ